MPEVLTILIGVGGLLGIGIFAFWAIAVIINKYL